MDEEPTAAFAASMADRRLVSPLRAVTIELSQSHVEEIDPAATVRFFADRSFNTLVVFALGYLHGETYYPSEHAPEREGLGGRDVFGEFVTEARAAGLGVVAYVNSFFGGPDAWEAHPDWTQRWADGNETVQGLAKGLCINSPYRDRILAVVGELAQRYDIDGVYLDEPSLQSWCSCEHCVARYRSETGRELPVDAVPESEEFAAFLEWRSGVVAEFVQQVGDAAHAADPELSVIAQHAFPMASTSDELFRYLFWGMDTGRHPPQFAGWYRPSFYGQDITQVARALDVVAIESWRRFVGTPPWWLGATVSYARSAGHRKPVMPLMEYPHFPWGLSRLSDDELAVSCADVVASGGELWWPMYAPGQADPTGWDRLAQVFAELDGIRPVGAVEAADAAVLFSRRTAEQLARGAADERYLDHVMGAVQLMRELHRPFQMLSAEAMTADDLAELNVLVAPNCACLDDREAALVAEWVAEGGHLVSIGPTATHDGAGAWRSDSLLTDVLGIVQQSETVAAGIGYLVATEAGVAAGLPDRMPARDDQQVLEVRTAEVLAQATPMWDLFEPPAEVEGHASITRNRHGRGLADHVALGVGRLRYRFELFESLVLLEALVNTRPAAIRGEALGPEVGIHAWRTAGSHHVMLVNMTSLGLTGRVSTLADQSVVVPAGLSVRSERGSDLTVVGRDDDQVVTWTRLADWDCLVVE